MLPARKKQGGYVRAADLERGETGRALCRWCSQETPKGRRTFCSDACVHNHRLRTNPGYLREQVLARDRGICAKCGVDTVALRRDMRRFDFAARRRFLREWGLTERNRKSLWDADHIVPVAEGGGQCDLANMRTLCLKCHREATTELRARLADRRSSPQ